jgi:alpha-1,6-mannosyltransferase
MLQHKWRWPIAVLMLAAALAFGYGLERSQFFLILSVYGIWFLLYAWVLWEILQYPAKHACGFWIWTGIALRMVLLFSVPALSDDYARFLWDGRLSAAGWHPFAQIPRFFMAPAAPVVPGIDTELFQRLNSPDYYTVYPPVCQAAYWLSGKLFPHSIIGGVITLKLVIVAGELLMLYLLGRLSNTPAKIPMAIYALNPLVIVELSGNAHFEGLMLAFMLATIYFFQQKKIAQAGVTWALAFATKLLPLLLVPIIAAWLGWRKALVFGVAFGLTALALFLPLFDWPIISNMLQSIGLYFGLFEFNASVFYLSRWVANHFYPWDTAPMVTPVLSLLTVAMIGIFSIYTALNRNKTTIQLATMLSWAMFGYLILSTTVHPWYVCVPFALHLLAVQKFNFYQLIHPIWIWTFLVFFSYSRYFKDNMQGEIWAWIIAEYALLALAGLAARFLHVRVTRFLE